MLGSTGRSAVWPGISKKGGHYYLLRSGSVRNVHTYVRTASHNDAHKDRQSFSLGPNRIASATKYGQPFIDAEVKAIAQKSSRT